MKFPLIGSVLVASALSFPSGANALTYNFGGVAGGPESSTFACNLAPGTCSVKFDNFKLIWNAGYLGGKWTYDSGSIYLYADAAQSSLRETFGTGSVFSENLGVAGAINNSTGFTIQNVIPGNILYTFLFSAPVTGSEGDSVYISDFGYPSQGDAFYPMPVPGPVTSGVVSPLNTWITGQSAPGPLGLLALSPFMALIYKRSKLLATKESPKSSINVF